jgi:hypothetical protein
MKPKEILAIAQDYAAIMADDDWFAETFNTFRESYNVRKSVELTLLYMYGESVCEMIIGEK